MRTVRYVFGRLVTLVGRRHREGEFSAELESHIDMHTAENIRAGLSPDEARRRALVALGGVEHTRERYRDASGLAWLEAIPVEIRSGFRAMRRSAGFTVLAVVTLSVGIAATNTAFTIVNTVMIRDLPFEAADRLVDVGIIDSTDGDASLSYEDFKDWERSTRSFVGLGAFQSGTMNVSDDVLAPERVLGSYVSAHTFRLLRTQPVFGRDFTIDDDRSGAAPVVILAYRVWKDRYQGDPGVLGRTIRVNAQPATVIGVMPEGMEFPMNTGLWQPLAMMRGVTSQPRDSRTLAVFGRLADGVSVPEATAELNSIATALARDFPQTNRGTGARIERLRPGIGTPWFVIFGAMMAAVGLLLLVSCANVANLLLARSIQRSREVSIRASLGATRSQITRQLLIESMMLAAVAGIVALPLSIAAIRLFVRLSEEIGRPFWMDFSMDAMVFVFLTGICLGTAIVFGLAPALHLSRAGTNDVLKESSGRTGTAGKRTRRWSDAFVVAEVVLTVVLLVGAVSMMRHLAAEAGVNPDLETSRLLTMTLRLPSEKYPAEADRSAFYQRLEEQLRSVQRAAPVTIAASPPLMGGGRREVSIDGRLPAVGEELPSVQRVSIGSRYFETLGLRPIRGRTLTDDDAQPGRKAVMVNRRFAERFFPAVDPISRSVTLLGDSQVPQRVTIVGIAPDLLADMTQVEPVVYLPYLVESGASLSLVARSEQSVELTAGMLRNEVRSIDPDLPLFDVRTLDETLDYLLWVNRVFGGMFAIFAGIAVVIATVGIYGVVSYSTALRTQEIGIRMALGAPRPRLWWTMIRGRIVQVGIGLSLGVVVAFVLLRLMGGLLVGRFGQDPLTFGAAAAFLLFMSLTAVVWPIVRATGGNPVAALRYE
jgi:putative ABC transport system permease protein